MILLYIIFFYKQGRIQDFKRWAVHITSTKNESLYIIRAGSIMAPLTCLKPMDSFGMWWKSNETFFLHWIIISYSFMWIANALSIFAQKCSNCQEITKISNCSGSLEYSAIGNINIHRDILLLGINYYITTYMSFKTIADRFNGDGMVHFPKIEKIL